MGMGFAPTWLRKVSPHPLLHKTTLTADFQHSGWPVDPDTNIVNIVDYHAAIGGQDPRAPLRTPVTSAVLRNMACVRVYTYVCTGRPDGSSPGSRRRSHTHRRVADSTRS